MNVPFVPGHFYHVFNRGNNSQTIFFNEENFRYFIRQFDKYLDNFIDVFAYCLLFNHFHFLIRVKEEKELLRMPSFGKMASLNVNRIITNQFRRLFISYSMAINKQEGRTGSLFQKNFKRKWIKNEKYLTTTIYYIHRNPIHHKHSSRFDDYQWSSYKSIITNSKSKLKRDEVLKWFDGEKEFIRFHEDVLHTDDMLKYIIE